MTKFSKGDRVVLDKDSYYKITGWDTEMRIRTIWKDGACSCILPSGVSGTFNADQLTKIGGTMSKYDELKNRIEDNRVAELGWGKGLDDVLQEINAPYSIMMGAALVEGFMGIIYIVEYGKDATHKQRIDGYIIPKFRYDGQCSKNTALHDAALWLLEHSDIKKDEKADKIKELEATMKDIQRQIGELK